MADRVFLILVKDKYEPNEHFITELKPGFETTTWFDSDINAWVAKKKNTQVQRLKWVV